MSENGVWMVKCEIVSGISYSPEFLSNNNVMPNHVRLSATETVFRKRLKTHLFRQYYM